ncbi:MULTISPECIES: hypothetical protein [unclassified Maridesulfovibrio]|uniref:hypothetical protein n=1 Tax=unclassified Maridesulfovibrio TaxID=2794999 RepID=UPI003B3CC540
MENLVHLKFDERGDSATTIQNLSDNIRVLANMETSNDNETKTIHWLIDLLAEGVTNIAETIRR